MRVLFWLVILGVVLSVPLAFLSRTAFGADLLFLGVLEAIAGALGLFNVAGTLDKSRAVALYRREHPSRWMGSSQPRWMLHPVSLRIISGIAIAIGLIFMASGAGVMAGR